MSDRIERLERLNKLKEQGILTQEQLDKEVELLLSSSGGDGQDKANKIEDSTSIELSAGVEIGAANRKFRLIKKIGSGGMGQVWQARDLAEEAAYKEEGKDAKHRYKALKVVNPHLMHSAVAIKQLQKEAMRAAELSHPNIINVHGWHKGTEGWLFVEMEYLQGHDLEEHLSDYEQGMSWDDCLKISQGIADGLDYAHQQQQIIHRDLKPSNIFITEQQQIKILDFGLAYQLRKSRLTGNSDSQSSGTTEYMPPEAFYANTPDARYDVYAFACLVYEMLTGQAPYSKEKAVKRDVDEWPPRPEKLNDMSWQVLKQGLAYDKEQRIRSIKRLMDVLQKGEIENVEKEGGTKGKLTKQNSQFKSPEIKQEEVRLSGTLFGIDKSLSIYIFCNLVLLRVIWFLFLIDGSFTQLSTLKVLFVIFEGSISWYLWKNIKALSCFSMLMGLLFLGLAFCVLGAAIGTGEHLATSLFVTVILPLQYWWRYYEKIKLLESIKFILINMCLYFLILDAMQAVLIL